VLDRPGHVGHLVAEQGDFFQRIAFQAVGERRRQEEQVGQPTGRVGQGENGPAGAVEIARWRDMRCHAEGVAHGQAAHAKQRANLQLNRDDKPVVAINQRVFHQEHASQVGRAGFQVAQVHASILEFPIAIRRHAGIAHRGGEHGPEVDRRDGQGLLRAAQVGRRRRAKRVPVQSPIGVFLRREHRCLIVELCRQRERVFLPVLHPRAAGLGRWLCHEALVPVQPRRRCRLHLVGVRPGEREGRRQAGQRPVLGDERAQRLGHQAPIDRAAREQGLPCFTPGIGQPGIAFGKRGIVDVETEPGAPQAAAGIGDSGCGQPAQQVFAGFGGQSRVAGPRRFALDKDF